MNSLQKSLVSMAGDDNGWEVASEEQESVTLTSAHHRANAVVRHNPEGTGWTVQLPTGRLTGELTRIQGGSTPTGPTTFQVPSESALGNLLSHAGNRENRRTIWPIASTKERRGRAAAIAEIELWNQQGA